MKNWKTTTLGVLTLLGAVCNAGIQYLKTGTCDLAMLSLGFTAGLGLIKAVDAK